ncbi:MAG: hypothetical protein R3E90_10895 [Marinicella sp.]|nr:hypothetical protein [Xanthomonadales bacterium]
MNFPVYTILEKQLATEQPSLRLVLELDPELDFFDGHFEQVPILPAVAQLYIVNKLANQYFLINKGFCGLRQLKFMSPIQPKDPAQLHIQYNPLKEQLSFFYEVKGQVKSKGILLYQLDKTHE